MAVSEKVSHRDLLSMTTDIVSSHVANNLVHADEIPALIQKTYQTLAGVEVESGILNAGDQQPFVPIKKSITPDYLICLEDGKKLKMLRRHLKTAYGMSPEEYRAKWGLPSDYPMVAPNYAKKRSKLAKDIGLGKR